MSKPDNNNYDGLIIGPPQVGRTYAPVTAQTIAGLKPGESITTYVRSTDTGNRAVHSIILRTREDDSAQ